MRQVVRIQTFKRLWRDFPEIWRICDEWSMDFSAHVPVVKVFTTDLLRRRVGMNEWWVVLSEIKGTLKCRKLHAIRYDRSPGERSLKTALTQDIDLPSWNIEYVVLRPSNWNEQQQLEIYKAPKGQKINDLCHNIKVVT